MSCRHNIPLHRAVITLNESQSYHKWLFGKYMDVLASARRLNRGKSFRLDSKYGFDADRVGLCPATSRELQDLAASVG